MCALVVRRQDEGCTTAGAGAGLQPGEAVGADVVSAAREADDRLDHIVLTDRTGGREADPRLWLWPWPWSRNERLDRSFVRFVITCVSHSSSGVSKLLDGKWSDYDSISVSYLTDGQGTYGCASERADPAGR